MSNRLNQQELLKTVTEFREGILQGRPSSWMCGAVCHPLVSFLTLVGYHVRLAQGVVNCGDYEVHHAWLKWGRGNKRIIDPTADQFPFGLPPVYIGPPLKTYREQCCDNY